jgi:hypothetical protein
VTGVDSYLEIVVNIMQFFLRGIQNTDIDFILYKRKNSQFKVTTEKDFILLVKIQGIQYTREKVLEF